MDISFLKELISCARGEIPADIHILNGTLINVITRETYLADISIYKNRIANVAKPGVLDPQYCKKVIDARDKYISPGFIESHLHIESTMLPPSEFAKLVVPQGTTTVIMDPHEIGNALGEKGLKLSGGQKQRVAIAQAILKEPKILILDEATSHLDIETETKVQKAFQYLMDKTTTIIIAHRLSTIKHADVIAVLENGTIIETGNHGELMCKDSIYKLLYTEYSTI